MLTLHVSVPVACFRRGAAREYLETDPLPPPATCYGMLLSLVGETDRRRHRGVRVTAGLLADTETSVVLRTVWRVKSRPLGSPGNTRPDYQQLLTGALRRHPFVELAVYLDSGEEADATPTLEDRVRVALDRSRRGTVARFGGLSLGESTHLVDSVSVADPASLAAGGFAGQRLFVTNDAGRVSVPVWVDHVGSAGTVYAVGDWEPRDDLAPPAVGRMPAIVSGR